MERTAKLIELRDTRCALKRVLALSQYPQTEYCFQAKIWSGEANMHEIAQIPIPPNILNEMLAKARVELRIVEDQIQKIEQENK